MGAGSGAVRREGGAVEPARPGVGLVAGFVCADPAVGGWRPLEAVGRRWLDVARCQCPVPLSCVSAGRRGGFRCFLAVLSCVVASTSTIKFLF